MNKQNILLVLVLAVIWVHMFDRAASEKRHQAELKMEISLFRDGTAYNDGHRCLSALNDIWKGRTNSAVETLEEKLYEDVYQIAQERAKNPAVKLESHYVELLTGVRDYRIQHPSSIPYRADFDRLIVSLLVSTNSPATK